MKPAGKFTFEVPKRRLPEVRTDALDVKIEREPYWFNVSFSWFCSACQRYHWAKENGLQHPRHLTCLCIVLDCSETKVTMPWSRKFPLDQTSIYGEGR
jgi:hypothetical protein